MLAGTIYDLISLIMLRFAHCLLASCTCGVAGHDQTQGLHRGGKGSSAGDGICEMPVLSAYLAELLNHGSELLSSFQELCLLGCQLLHQPSVVGLRLGAHVAL